MRRPLMALALAGLLTLTLGLGATLATPAARSTQPVVQTWDGTQVGTSTLVRTDAGLSASFHSSGLPAGQAVTLWFVVFNNPSACGGPCGLADLLDPDQAAKGDFLVGAGHVVGGSGVANFGAHLAVDDTRGSAFLELRGLEDMAIGLTNPRGAQVGLLLHSHGPMVPGQVLKAQLSSFTGGCTVFLGDLEGEDFEGNSGIADSADDVPDAVGECSTILASIHMP